MEELKVTLNSGSATPAGQEPDAQELKATLEALKMEHQLEMENLKAKHKIEAALLTKEREDLSVRLQELRERPEAWRSEVEAGEKVERAERRAAEAEQVEAELKRKLDLLEKKMEDYEALQKAQAESREEIQTLEEKLRVTANQLQALQADRYGSQDANVRTGQSETSTPPRRRPPSNRSFVLQVIEDNEISEEKMKLKQSVEGIRRHGYGGRGRSQRGEAVTSPLFLQRRWRSCRRGRRRCRLSPPRWKVSSLSWQVKVMMSPVT